MNFTKFTTFLILLCTVSAYAQNTNSEDDKLSLDSGTLDNQFEYVITKSSGWSDERGQNYRVVKSFWLTDLKKHTLDSLQLIKKDLISTNITLKAQSQEIEDLKSSLTNIQNSLSKTKDEKNNISLLGAQMSKGGYSALMWTIIGLLIVVLLFFIYKFKNSNVLTKNSKQLLQDLEDEFEEHRKTAVEREQKIRRQLLDEINKQKVNKGKKQ
jgi:hypothetical protein